MKHILHTKYGKVVFFNSLFNLYWIFSNFIAAKTIYLSTLLVRVWVCGSSIVKHAFTEARQKTGGINLGLERLRAHIWWQEKGEMLASQLPRQIRIMLQFEDPPSYLVVHVGGNDIGKGKKWVFAQQFDAFSLDNSKKTSKYNYCLVADFTP